MSAQQDRPAVEVVLHEERLRVGTERVPVERVVVRRRVITEVRQVEVTVRREELEVSHVPLDGLDSTVPAGATPRPLIIVLSEEVPVVDLQTRPYERITVWVDTVTGEQDVTETVSRELADVVSDPPAPDGAT